MTERTLFPTDPPDKPPSPKLPHNRTATSKLAAQSMRPLAGAQQQRVLECLQQAGAAGLTDEEIQTALNLSGNSERPRRSRLVELGQVEDSHNMRMNRSGRPATVWIAVSPDKRPALASKGDWPTNGKSNPNRAGATECVVDFQI